MPLTQRHRKYRLKLMLWEIPSWCREMRRESEEISASAQIRDDRAYVTRLPTRPGLKVGSKQDYR